jgi:hypothetical protein
MPQAKKRAKREIADKVQLIVYEEDEELWDSMQEVAAQSTKSGALWYLAKIGAVHAAEHHQERIQQVTETCERLALMITGESGQDDNIPAAFRRKKKASEKTA